LFPLDQLLLFVIALAANVVSTFSGTGAGLIQLPALIFLGLPFPIALATHKLASDALGIGATLRYLREGHFERRFWLPMLLGGLPGGFIGANIIIEVPDRVADRAGPPDRWAWNIFIDPTPAGPAARAAPVRCGRPHGGRRGCF
jgi:uncharacterized protein